MTNTAKWLSRTVWAQPEEEKMISSAGCLPVAAESLSWHLLPPGILLDLRPWDQHNHEGLHLHESHSAWCVRVCLCVCMCVCDCVRVWVTAYSLTSKCVALVSQQAVFFVGFFLRFLRFLKKQTKENSLNRQMVVFLHKVDRRLFKSTSWNKYVCFLNLSGGVLIIEVPRKKHGKAFFFCRLRAGGGVRERRKESRGKGSQHYYRWTLR